MEKYEAKWGENVGKTNFERGKLLQGTDKGKEKVKRVEKGRSQIQWRGCGTFARAWHKKVPLAAIHGELHLQQKEVKGSILQELSLETAKVQQE